jgi:hypothetical protein
MELQELFQKGRKEKRLQKSETVPLITGDAYIDSKDGLERNLDSFRTEGRHS